MHAVLLVCRHRHLPASLHTRFLACPYLFPCVLLFNYSLGLAYLLTYLLTCILLTSSSTSLVNYVHRYVPRQRGTYRPTLNYLLTNSLTDLPAYLVACMDKHLLNGPHHNMRTLRAHLSNSIYLLTTQTTT